MRVRVDIAYDGTGFHGFARQPGLPTLQGVVEDALGRLLGEPVTTTGAGRTDAGVHATAQTLHTDVPADARLVADVERARRALDDLCGTQISVWRIRRVPATFDARHSAVQRRYHYCLCDAATMNPLWRHDTWHVGGPRLDTEAMVAGGSQLLGEHDFSSFCRRGGQDNLVRRIDRLDVRRGPPDLVTVRIAGPAFCHQLVRSVVGCLLAVGRGRRSPTWMGEALEARDRQAAGQVAPPHGLTLVGVSYR